MRNCFDCGRTYDANSQLYIRCGHSPCAEWTHRECLSANDLSKTNQWYCANHLEEIHVPLRKSTSTPTTQNESIINLSNLFRDVRPFGRRIMFIERERLRALEL